MAVNPFTVVYSEALSDSYSVVVTGVGLTPGTLWNVTITMSTGTFSPSDTVGVGGSMFAGLILPCSNQTTGITATGTPLGGGQTTFTLPAGPDASVCP